jgi:hypothetical protein
MQSCKPSRLKVLFMTLCDLHILVVYNCNIPSVSVTGKLPGLKIWEYAVFIAFVQMCTVVRDHLVSASVHLASFCSNNL